MLLELICVDWPTTFQRRVLASKPCMNHASCACPSMLRLASCKASQPTTTRAPPRFGSRQAWWSRYWRQSSVQTSASCPQAMRSWMRMRCGAEGSGPRRTGMCSK